MKMIRLAFALSLATLVFAHPNVSFAGHVYTGLDLRLDLQNKKEVSLVREDTSKKATVLVFLSAKCPCSMSHTEEIKALALEFSEFRFIGVNSNTDESIEMAQKFFSTQSFSFPILKDEKAALADEMKAVKTPHAFIVANDGKVLFQGGVSNSATFDRADRRYLREALDDIKAGRKVSTPLARALGCIIPHGG